MLDSEKHRVVLKDETLKEQVSINAPFISRVALDSDNTSFSKDKRRKEKKKVKIFSEIISL